MISKLRLPALTLVPALLLGGCIFGGDDDDGGPQAYSNQRLGISLTFPAGWILAPYPLGDSAFIVLLAYTPNLVQGSASIVTWPYDSTETLEEFAADRYYPFSTIDSAKILPREARQGVDIVPVDVWRTYEEDPPPDNHLRERVLIFRRGDKIVELNLQDDQAHYDANTHLPAIDSSLTFF